MPETPSITVNVKADFTAFNAAVEDAREQIERLGRSARAARRPLKGLHAMLQELGSLGGATPAEDHARPRRRRGQLRRLTADDRAKKRERNLRRGRGAVA